MKASQMGTLIAILAGDSGPTKVTIDMAKQIYSEDDADPNVAVIVPDNQSIANIYYQDPAALGATGTDYWLWSKTDHTWHQFSL